MSYKHLSTYERGCIELLHQSGHSGRQIAQQLGRHHSCINRELKRSQSLSSYRAQQAQNRYHACRKHSKPYGKWNPIIAKDIEEKLICTWSPEQIAQSAQQYKISFKTIYNWLYQGKLEQTTEKNLRHKGKRRRAHDARGTFSMGVPISQRPKEVDSRESFGHWELDTMVSSRGKSKGCLATFIERKTRFYLAIKIPNRTASSMKQAIEQVLKVVPSQSFKTGTTDRGKEFACHHEVLNQLDIQLYFADAYSSWQRGSNENANGLLREFYPKQTDLALISEQQLQSNLLLINSRPRKCLGWKTTKQAFLHEVAHLA